MKELTAIRRVNRFLSDKTRVLARPFLPDNPARLARITQRILSLSESETGRVLHKIMLDFERRHRDIRLIFLRHYQMLRHLLSDNDPLSRRTNGLSDERKLLLGAYFTCEYSIEAAAFFNPSIVAHPNQDNLPQGSTRFIISFRATGEGHVSSIVFRTGTINANHALQFDPVSPYVETPQKTENPSYDKNTFRLKLSEMGSFNDISQTILGNLDDQFTLNQLNDQVWYYGEGHPAPGADKTLEEIKWLALSNYQLCFRSDRDLSECVIFPVSNNESKGLEDARFVRFTDDDATVTYYATYTAYNGFAILPQLLSTRDFLTFDIATLNGKSARNKGMAMFPRKIGGRYMMVSRQDGENMYVMASDNLHFWNAATLLRKPAEPWEFFQLGNCGSPIETEAGWLVLTHGVGAMRQYCIGAILLDLDDPSRIVGRLRQPLLIPDEQEREGYVPNVVYSCGAMVHRGELIIPYAMSDSVSGIATLSVDDLLESLLHNK